MGTSTSSWFDLQRYVEHHEFPQAVEGQLRTTHGQFRFANANDGEAVDAYFESSFPDEAYTTLGANDKRIVLSMHKLLFDMQKCLPFSFKGVHVLEDRGADFHEFGNAGGGKWRNLYGDYIAATSGRVEAMSVAVSTWGGQGGGIRLCVGVRKAGRNHHALQMDFKDCEWVEDPRVLGGLPRRQDGTDPQCDRIDRRRGIRGRRLARKRTGLSVPG